MSKLTPAQRKEVVDIVEKHLWDFVCSGGGNGETIRAKARAIVRSLDRKTFKPEPRP